MNGPPAIRRHHTDAAHPTVGLSASVVRRWAYALALHGRPRATGDLHVCVAADPANAARVMTALKAFGAPMSEITQADFARPGVVYQIGIPPGRFGDIEVDFIGREAFVRNKRTIGRPKDLGGIEGLS